jgi:transglutaminase-like putative cysteine protease
MSKITLKRMGRVTAFSLAVLGAGFSVFYALHTPKTDAVAGDNAASTYEIVSDLPQIPMAKAPGLTYPLTPAAPGAGMGNDRVSIDAANAAEGYVMVRYSGSSSKVKLQIAKIGDITYTYNLYAGAGYEVFPFTCGDGTYTVNVYEHAFDNQYSLAYGTTVTVSLVNSFQPFLYPNQYIKFSSQSKVVALSEQLAQGAASDLEILSRIYNHTIKSITYDNYKAATVKSGYLPDVDAILDSGKGICFDYAAVMVSMLRTQAIPARLEIGYVTGGLYHAWISAYISEIGWVNNIIQFDGQNWKLMDPTFASGGKQSDNIMSFIGNTANYSAKYVY